MKDTSTFHTLQEANENEALPIVLIPKKRFQDWMQQQTPALKSWFEVNNFKGEAGSYCVLPSKEGGPKGLVASIDSEDDLWSYAALAKALPARLYRIENSLHKPAATRAALGWVMASYAFRRYFSKEQAFASLIWPRETDRSHVHNMASAIFLIRDLINTPANDMGPDELEFAAYELAKQFDAKIYSVVGSDLIKKNLPLIHTVGRASQREPRLIDIRWTGPAADGAPLVVLVGKGVCFDTGGLDIKNERNMRNMKKDMAGAAHVLGLASLIMAEALPVRLRILIPAVENAISGNAMRPLDIVRSRKGLSVEIGNTDAEGRLVLADALTLAAEDNPDIIIDIATLTGAARVALGAELPAFFTNDDKLADTLLKVAEEEGDHLWRLPLYAPYKKLLKSKIADLSNVSESAYGGAILAALFLQHFVPPKRPWIHLDIMAWNLEARPGRPVGGEAMAIRSLLAYLRRMIMAKS